VVNGFKKGGKGMSPGVSYRALIVVQEFDERKVGVDIDWTCQFGRSRLGPLAFILAFTSEILYTRPLANVEAHSGSSKTYQ